LGSECQTFQGKEYLAIFSPPSLTTLLYWLPTDRQPFSFPICFFVNKENSKDCTWLAVLLHVNEDGKAGRAQGIVMLEPFSLPLNL